MGNIFITEGSADFCSKKVLLLTSNFFYYIDVYENGYLQNIVPTSSFITLVKSIGSNQLLNF